MKIQKTAGAKRTADKSHDKNGAIEVIEGTNEIRAHGFYAEVFKAAEKHLGITGSELLDELIDRQQLKQSNGAVARLAEHYIPASLRPYFRRALLRQSDRYVNFTAALMEVRHGSS